MKTSPIRSIGLLIAGAALLLQAPFALAQHVNWSVSVGTPYAQPVYVPQPVYVEPQRVYVPPPRVYVAPQPVYVQSYAPPVAVVQYQNYGQPAYYVGQGYRHGHGHGHHGGHHGHRD